MLRLTIARSLSEMEELRKPWERLADSPDYTIFQRFDFNLLAAQIFSEPQPLLVVKAESDSGLSIIPACIDIQGKRITLLGEELFDYRCALTQGDPALLNECWRTLTDFAAEQGLGFGFHSLPEDQRTFAESCGIPLIPFATAPYTLSGDRDTFHHPRLALNLRRLQRAGVVVRQRNGHDTAFVHELYRRKSHEPGSLFSDPARLLMATAMAEAAGHSCEIFTLEQGTTLVAALLTYSDGPWRRFYTTYYDHGWAKHSPGLTLLHEVVRQTLEAGLHCDFMTGDQPYKRRLASGAMPLWRIELSAEQMRSSTGQQSLKQIA